jgi:Rrf2 family protein
MKINTQVQYGVRSLFDIAFNSAGNPVHARDISERQGISRNYIEQIFRRLTKGGLARGLHGPTGGYILTRRPEEISVGDVIRAIDGKNIELVDCHGDKRESKKPCERLEKCVLSDIWSEASKGLMDYFDSVTLLRICNVARQKGVGI